MLFENKTDAPAPIPIFGSACTGTTYGGYGGYILLLVSSTALLLASPLLARLLTLLNPGPAQSTGYDKTSTQSHHGLHNESQKRSRSRQGSRSGTFDGYGGFDDGASVTTARSKRARTDPGNRPLFACPFYKHNPIKHMKCMTQNHLTDLSFVVQHLQRSHLAQPNYCPTCGETYPTRTECDSHVRARTCDNRPFRLEGITEDQLARIRQRGPRVNPMEKWNYYYNIIFPGKLLPTSPYVNDTLTEFILISKRIIRLNQDHFRGDPVRECLLTHPAISFADLFLLTPEIVNLYFDPAYIQRSVPDQDDLSFLASDHQTTYCEEQQVFVSVTDSAASQALERELQLFTDTSQLNLTWTLGPSMNTTLDGYEEGHSGDTEAEGQGNADE